MFFFHKYSCKVLKTLKIAEFFSIFRTAIKKRSHSTGFGSSVGESLENLGIFHDSEEANFDFSEGRGGRGREEKKGTTCAN